MLHITEPVDLLSSSEFAAIKTAWQYTILPDTAILLSVPTPIGYIYWHNNSPRFHSEAETMLKDLNINPIVK